MFRRSLPVWLILTMFAGAPANAQMPFPRDVIPGRGALERVGLERQWFAVIPLVETERLVGISRTQDMLFAQTNYARLHALDAETGRLLWMAELGERAAFPRGVAANSWGVFVTNANMLFALDRGTGRRIWRQNLDTLPTSSPACDEARVMVGLTSGMLTGYRLKRTDNKGNEYIRDAAYPLWKWHAGGPIRTRPLPAESVVAYGGGDNRAYVVMADEPTQVFRVSTGGAIGEGLGGYGTRTLLIPSADNTLYAVDLFTARMLWTFPSGAPILQEPLVADQDVFTINSAGNLTSLDPENGQPRWTTATPGGRLAAVSAGKIYLRSYNLDLFIIDRATGRMVVDPGESHLRAGLNLRDYDLNIVNRFNDRTHFATRSGLILTMREIGQVEPRLLRDPKQPPFGYVPPGGLKDASPLTPTATPTTEPEQPAAGQDAAPAGDAGAAPAGEEKKDTP